MSSRLQSLWKARLAFRDGGEQVASASALTAPPSLNFPYRMFVPTHYEPHYDYPLVVWLHSDSSSEYELDPVMEALSVRNYIAIAPRGPRAIKKESRRFRWGTHIADLAIAEDLVMDAIAEVSQSLSIATDRIFVAGFGAGGSVAQWLSLRHPDRFAGGISINGPFPKTRRALSQWKGARRVPVLFMQGSDSKGCTVDDTISAMQLAHSAGLQYQFLRFELSELAETAEDLDSTGVDAAAAADSLDVEMLRAADRFMMGIVTGCDIPLVSPEPSPVSVTVFGDN